MMETVNVVAELHEYATRTRSELKYDEVPGPTHGPFTIRAVLNDQVYPDGVGKTKKEAKKCAAINALKCLLEAEHLESAESAGCTSSQQSEALDASDICERIRRLGVSSKLHKKKQSETRSNFIGLINNYCQKKKHCISYIQERKGGTHVNPQFVYKVMIDKKEYPEAEGKTIVEAKQNAARLAWEALEQQSDFDSKVSLTRSTSSTTTESHESPTQSIVPSTGATAGVTSPSSPSEAQILVQSEDDAPTRLSSPTSLESLASSPSITTDTSSSGRASDSSNSSKDQVSVRSSNSDDGDRPNFRSQPMTEDLNESSSESTSVSTSDSVVFTDSAIASMSRMPSRSDVSEDHAPSQMPLKSSLESSSQNVTTDTSSSGQAIGSWTSSNDQAVEKKTMGSNLNEISVHPRFTSDYDDMKHLGSGGFGCVHKARDKLVDEYFAVKIVCYEENCLREVKTLSKLFHTNIVRYYDCWVENSGCPLDNKSPGKFLYIKMELCDQKTLRKWIDEKNNEPLSVAKRREESLAIAQQIASGVEHIHNQKHIHRDLKPDNILFQGDTVKIGDFGLVTINDASLERTRKAGTPTYMAPEQKKQRSYNHKVDIFALGLIYLELFWKLSSWHERGKTLIKARRSRMFPEEFARTFPEEKETIRSMLCANPEGRPDASEVRGQLEKLGQILETQKMLDRNVTDESAEESCTC